MRIARRSLAVLVLLLLLVTTAAWLRVRGDRSRASAYLRERYAVVRTGMEARLRGDRVYRDLTYVERPGWRGTLDLYVPRGGGPHPVVVYFHGGGWVSGTKDLASLHATAHRRLGYAVANVAYRLTPQASAPAAVADARCAVRWLAANAERLNLDGERIVAAGHSAGGHLALMTALAPEEAALAAGCAKVDARPIAVLNWYGPSDLSALLEVPDARGFTAYWLGDSSGAERFRHRMSPISHVRRGAPAIFTAHGARDALVPVDQSRRLHAELEAVGAHHALVVLPEHGHGFGRQRTQELLDSARNFLSANPRGRPQPEP